MYFNIFASCKIIAKEVEKVNCYFCKILTGKIIQNDCFIGTDRGRRAHAGFDKSPPP